MRVIRIEKFGDPEVMNCIDVLIPKPKATQVLLRLKAVGVNYIDIYQRTGLYKVDLPNVLGLEGAGIVETVGKLLLLP